MIRILNIFMKKPMKGGNPAKERKVENNWNLFCLVIIFVWMLLIELIKLIFIWIIILKIIIVYKMK